MKDDSELGPVDEVSTSEEADKRTQNEINRDALAKAVSVIVEEGSCSNPRWLDKDAGTMLCEFTHPQLGNNKTMLLAEGEGEETDVGAALFAYILADKKLKEKLDAS